MKPKVCILKTDGTNCDTETAHAFRLVGGMAEIVHINSLKKGFDPVARKEVKLEDFEILAIPGGFSHGDYVQAGKILAYDLEHYLGEDVQQFLEEGKLLIGICNGFQVLVQAGYLPMMDGKKEHSSTLIFNESQRFEDRWVKLVSPPNRCIWTEGIESIDLPVAHGEGRFVTSSDIYGELFNHGMVVFQYAGIDGRPTMEHPANPNGSMHAIAGICDPTGRIFGLMPHPERYNNPKNHPLAHLQQILSKGDINREDPWVRERLQMVGELPEEGLGLKVFRNAVNYFR